MVTKRFAIFDFFLLMVIYLKFSDETSHKLKLELKFESNFNWIISTIIIIIACKINVLITKMNQISCAVCSMTLALRFIRRHHQEYQQDCNLPADQTFLK